MNRIVFWIVVIALGYLAWRLVLITQRKQARMRERQAARNDAAAANAPRGGRPVPAEAQRLSPGETMVPCAHCGIYLPASESLERAGLPYCSGEHRDAGPAPGPRA